VTQRLRRRSLAGGFSLLCALTFTSYLHWILPALDCCPQRSWWTRQYRRSRLLTGRSFPAGRIFPPSAVRQPSYTHTALDDFLPLISPEQDTPAGTQPYWSATCSGGSEKSKERVRITMYQSRCLLSQIHLINSYAFYTGKGDWLKKNYEVTRGRRPTPPPCTRYCRPV